MFDVVIVGSGPAGAMTAVDLARHGMRVCLVERATHPRYKVCGGGLLARAARLLPVDMKPVVAHECRRVELRFAGGGRGYRTERDRPVVFMTMRSAFDRLLVAEAVRYGAVLREESPVTGVSVEADRVVVRADFGSKSRTESITTARRVPGSLTR